MSTRTLKQEFKVLMCFGLKMTDKRPYSIICLTLRTPTPSHALKTKNIGLGHFGGIATANARVLTENPNDDTYYAETYKEASSTAAIFDVYNNGQ